jgi:RNA polymerase sigma-70 factor (ECF subfamily)
MLVHSEFFPLIGMPDEPHPRELFSGGAAARRAPASGPLPALSRLPALVAQMAQGRQEALAALYDETSPMLNGLLRRMLEKPEDAEEILLDVYLKAWKNAGAYNGQRGSVQAWLVIMARNAAIDRIRQHRAQPRVVGLEIENGVDPISPEDSPETLTASEQRTRRIRAVIGQLPAEQREAVELAFFGGLTHFELAERLGEPLGTIKSRIRMGLIRLRTLLEEVDAR